MNSSKICTRCKNEKDALNDFYKESRGGMSCVCKDCHKKRMSDIRRDNPEVRERERIRAKQPHRMAKSAAISRMWRERNPEAYKAHTSLNNAIRDGRIVKEPCSVCGSTERIHAHHKDYSKPLNVIWLCARCHHRIHALFPEIEGNNKSSKVS